MSTREIPKKPHVPSLTDEQIRLLTELCFRSESREIPQVDLIFVFGTAVSFQEVGESLKKVIDRSNLILFTGGVERYVDSIVHERPESEMLYDIVKKDIPNTTKVVLETSSRNTLENVQFGLKLIEKPKSLCFIVKGFHSGRAYLTLRKFLADAKIYQDSFDPTYPNSEKKMTRENWYLDEEYRARVWGEYLRIKTYGERKDLDFSEVQDLLRSINGTVSLG